MQQACNDSFRIIRADDFNSMDDLECCRLIINEDEIPDRIYVKVNRKFRQYWGLIESPPRRWKLNQEGLELRKRLNSIIPFINGVWGTKYERIPPNGENK